jgi:hypothetical protein
MNIHWVSYGTMISHPLWRHLLMVGKGLMHEIIQTMALTNSKARS